MIALLLGQTFGLSSINAEKAAYVASKIAKREGPAKCGVEEYLVNSPTSTAHAHACVHFDFREGQQGCYDGKVGLPAEYLTDLDAEQNGANDGSCCDDGCAGELCDEVGFAGDLAGHDAHGWFVEGKGGKEIDAGHGSPQHPTRLSTNLATCKTCRVGLRASNDKTCTCNNCFIRHPP